MHTQSRVNKALPVLAALGELSDPQVALQLLRHCASFSKMVFSIRAVPASFHTEALLSFDAQVRACFEQFSTLHPDEEQWVQATLATTYQWRLGSPIARQAQPCCLLGFPQQLPGVLQAAGPFPYLAVHGWVGPCP